jgi:hemerythrin
MPIIWRKEMSVSNDAIDQDHRYLFCLINTIELALRTGENLEVLGVVIEQLCDYTEYHFEREEMIQEKIQYPKRSEHRAEHLAIMNDVSDLKKHIRTHESQAASAEPAAGDDQGAKQSSLESDDLVGLLRRWILDHVMKRDREMIPYLEQYPSSYR